MPPLGQKSPKCANFLRITTVDKRVSSLAAIQNALNLTRNRRRAILDRRMPLIFFSVRTILLYGMDMKDIFLGFRRFYSFAAMVAVFLMTSSVALAGNNDFRLADLCSNGKCSSEQSISDFKDLTKSYASILAPMHFQPASTLGQAGFEIGVESKMSFATEDASYWKATNKNDGVTSTDGKYAAPDVFATVQLHMRKGLPFSFEVEGIFNWLANSEIFYVGAGLRWAFTEGWWFMPDISVRAHVGTIIGAPELSLINVNMDIALSYTWGLGGIVAITPYAGYSLLTSWASSHPLQLGVDESGRSVEDVFRRVTHYMSRGFVGLELKADYFVFGIEGEFGSKIMSLGLKIGANF